jgi:endonuclease YncB( thermonuclease family)
VPQVVSPAARDAPKGRPAAPPASGEVAGAARRAAGRIARAGIAPARGPFGQRLSGLVGRRGGLAVAVAVPAIALLAIAAAWPERLAEPAPPPNVPGEPAVTGTVETTARGPLSGVPEILDTTTLSLQGQVVRLYGVEWSRGAGDPDDLARYLRGREVACTPLEGSDTYRCQVEDQDLSRVVLYNGGGRATADASPDLKRAEEHARESAVGVWADQRLKARP